MYQPLSCLHVSQKDRLRLSHSYIAADALLVSRRSRSLLRRHWRLGVGLYRLLGCSKRESEREGVCVWVRELDREKREIERGEREKER